MCNCRVTSYSRTRFIPLSHPHKLVSSFPCGWCADCINAKKSEFRLRAYYEAQSTFHAGGFCLFDTLTYRDDALKYYHDILGIEYYRFYHGFDKMAFSRHDVKTFFKLLRIRLKRAGYDVDGKLKYLLTSEFGTTEGCTHRPHYHILFFVRFDIDPLVLSKFISDCWPHGRTDGLPYKNWQYVIYQRVFRGNNAHLFKLVNYVTKYVTKDLYLTRKLLYRAWAYFDLYMPNWQYSYQGRLAFRRFKNHCLPFHLQSHGFGLSLIDDVDQVDHINEYGMAVIPSSTCSVVSSIPLPLYYRRKLYQFYEYYNGRLRWRYNDLGIAVMKANYYRSKKRLIDDLVDYGYDFNLSSSLAEYQLLWRGLFISRFDLGLSESELLDRFYDPLVYNTEFYYKNKLLLYNYSTECENYRYGKYISDIYVSDKISVPRRLGHFSSLSEFVKRPLLPVILLFLL